MLPSEKLQQQKVSSDERINCEKRTRMRERSSGGGRRRRQHHEHVVSIPLDPVITTGEASPNSTVDKRFRPELCEIMGCRLRSTATSNPTQSYVFDLPFVQASLV